MSVAPMRVNMCVGMHATLCTGTWYVCIVQGSVCVKSSNVNNSNHTDLLVPSLSLCTVIGWGLGSTRCLRSSAWCLPIRCLLGVLKWESVPCTFPHTLALDGRVFRVLTSALFMLTHSLP